MHLLFGVRYVKFVSFVIYKSDMFMIDQAHQATCTNSYTFSSLSHKDLHSIHVYQHVATCHRSGIEGNLEQVRLRKSDHATDIDANNYNKGLLTLL